MKKALTIILAALMLVSVLGGCSFSGEITETWDNSSDDREGSIALFDEFFAPTFKNTNQVVTGKNGDSDLFVETIDGTSDHIVYSTNGSETYSFLKGADHVYAMADEESKVYWVDETYYGYGYYAYKTYIQVFKNIPEDEENVTYSCRVKGEKTGDISTSTLTFELNRGEDGSILISATAKNGLVETVACTYAQEGQSRVLTFAFAYSSASVTLPDLADWDEQAVIPMDGE